MKTKISILAVALAFTTLFTSCKKEDNSEPSNDYGSNYIINYGSYDGDKGEISLLNIADSTVTNGYYESKNGVDLVSNIQYAYNTNGKIYFMGNNADQVFYTDEKTFIQSANGISGDLLVKPRYCVANNNTLYVSCWGGDIWDDPNLSYITKIDLNTNTIIDTFNLAGGPEGLAISNGKLYAALNYEKKIAVIDLNTNAISYIDAPAVSSYFVKDNNENLYVSLVSTYSSTAEKEGIGYINTQNDQMTVYEHSGISTSYVNIMSLNKDQSKLYVMTSAYNPNWELTGAIAVFNISTKTFLADNLVSGVTGLNGFAVNQANNDIYYFVSESVTANGKMISIKSDGTLIKEYITGIAPFMLLTIKE